MSLHRTTVSLAPIRHRHRHRHRPDPAPSILYVRTTGTTTTERDCSSRHVEKHGVAVWDLGASRRLHDWEAESRREPGAVRSKVQLKREAGRARGKSARHLNQKVESSLDYLRTWEHGGSYMNFFFCFLSIFFFFFY